MNSHLLRSDNIISSKLLSLGGLLLAVKIRFSVETFLEHQKETSECREQKGAGHLVTLRHNAREIRDWARKTETRRRRRGCFVFFLPSLGFSYIYVYVSALHHKYRPDIRCRKNMERFSLLSSRHSNVVSTQRLAVRRVLLSRVLNRKLELS